MILAVDVDYKGNNATVAGILYKNWTDKKPFKKYISKVKSVKKYIPGQFYKRELPCILKLLDEHNLKPKIIVIDGYVYLDGTTKPGLGKYLFDELNSTTPVIGVAKNPYKDITSPFEIYRRDSKRPLYVTSAGISVGIAKKKILVMAGKYRIPDLLRLVDQFARQS